MSKGIWKKEKKIVKHKCSEFCEKEFTEFHSRFLELIKGFRMSSSDNFSYVYKDKLKSGHEVYFSIGME